MSIENSFISIIIYKSYKINCGIHTDADQSNVSFLAWKRPDTTKQPMSRQIILQSDGKCTRVAELFGMEATSYNNAAYIRADNWAF